MELTDDARGVVTSHVLTTGDIVWFEARDIQQGRGGQKATVYIWLNSECIFFSDLHLKAHKERVTVYNAAYKRIPPPLQALYKDLQMQSDLDGFCHGVWAVWQGRLDIQSTLGASDTPLEYAMKPYLPLGGGTILFAPPESGKSTLVFLMAQSINSGISKLWGVPKPRKVLILNLERSDTSIQQRLRRVNQVLGLDPQAPIDRLVDGRGRMLQDMAESLHQYVEDHGVEVLILDSISRTAPRSLVEDVTANSIVNELNRICPSWLAIGHTPRENSDHIYGSVHFDAGVDVAVQLKSERRGNVLGITMTVTKANDMARPRPETYALTFNEGGLVSIENADATDFPALLEGSTSETAAVSEYLKRVVTATQATISDETGVDQRNLSRIFRGLGAIVVGKEGRRELWTIPVPDKRVPVETAPKDPF